MTPEEEFKHSAFDRIKHLVRIGDIKISNHGYSELSNDSIRVAELIDSLQGGTLVEDYPDFPKGPCCLILTWILFTGQFTQFGVCPKGIQDQQSWLWPTDQIQLFGQRIISGG